MHLSSQSQIDYLSLGISSPGFVCWQKAKAGADTWLIKCLSTMLTAVPEGRDRLCQCPVICYCCTHLTLVICLWGATFWGRLFLLQGSQGLSLLSSRFCGCSLETASPKAFCCNQNSQWPSSLDFRKGSHHWRTMEKFENLVF